MAKKRCVFGGKILKPKFKGHGLIVGNNITFHWLSYLQSICSGLVSLHILGRRRHSGLGRGRYGRQRRGGQPVIDLISSWSQFGNWSLTTSHLSLVTI